MARSDEPQYQPVSTVVVDDDKGEGHCSVAPPPYSANPEGGDARTTRRCRRKRRVVALTLASLLLLGFAAVHLRPLCHQMYRKYRHGKHQQRPFLLPGEFKAWENTFDVAQVPGDCVADIPYEGPGEFDFDPKVYDQFASRVYGVALSDINLVVDDQDVASVDDARIRVNAQVFVNEAKLLRGVNVKASKEKGGQDAGPHHSGNHFRLTVNTPHRARRGQCVKAKVTITVPKSLKAYRSVFLSYLAGNLHVDSAFKDVALHYFHVANVAGSVALPPIQSKGVIVTSVHGNVHGMFNTDNFFIVRTVNGNVKAHVNADHADHLRVKAQSVSGNVTLAVTDRFDGPFAVTSLSGSTKVVGDNVKLVKDTPHKKIGSHQANGDDAKEAIFKAQPIVHHDSASEAEFAHAIHDGFKTFHHAIQEIFHKAHSLLDHKVYHHIDPKLHLRPLVHEIDEDQEKTHRHHDLQRRRNDHHHSFKKPEPHNPHIRVGSLSGNLALHFV
ncbi:hypothetical protein H4R34_004713 [Dimargaris verticillata]|uniref:Adhesin domain-containing protein n=1 Tax=Dimargaris verticillata TaxID=2761393 RepID=A0A9W8B4C9_9FUNG|nr:hypothetical protein H4R34_004713 [Dimargaris verticillata]